MTTPNSFKKNHTKAMQDGLTKSVLLFLHSWTNTPTHVTPALPGRFCWRDNEYTVAEVVKCRKESGPDKYPSGQMYLRKHWFGVKTADGAIMTNYFERQARSKHDAKKRWWLYSLIVRE